MNPHTTNEGQESRTPEEGQSLLLSYTLTYAEAYTAFLYVARQGKEKARKYTGHCLIAVAAVFVVLYGLNPYQLEYMVLSLLTLAVWTGVVFSPSLRAKRGAKAVERAKGTYKIELFASGHIQPWGGSRLPLSGDKAARGCETPELFVIRPDNRHTFCLPKRAMKPKDIRYVRDTLSAHLKGFTPLAE